MKKYEVQDSLVIMQGNKYYTVKSDVYQWEPHYTYNAGEYVLYDNCLLIAKKRTLGKWFSNFERVKPTDYVTYTTTTDDLAPIYKSIDEIRKRLCLPPIVSGDCDCFPDLIDPDFSVYPCPCPPPPCTSGEVIDPDFTQPNINQLHERLSTVEQTYVRTINNETPLNGNINIDYDGSVMPPESDILRWTSGTLSLAPDNTLSFLIEGTKTDVFAYHNGVLELGNPNLHVNVSTVDTLTVNGESVLTTADAVDLINDQNIQGRKHFDAIFTTQSPQEDTQIPNKGWIVNKINQKIANVLRPELESPQTFYISQQNLTDTEDGTKKTPFKTLKNAIEYLKHLEINYQPITLEFVGKYYDNSERVELPDFGSEVTIVSRTGLDTELPPLYVTGKWRLERVTITDNRLEQCPIEVDKGFCTLSNVKISLRSPAHGTDAIYVHNGGTLQLAAGSNTLIENTSSTVVSHAIHLKAGGTILGNEDVHSNIGEPNSLDISSDNGSFGVALVLENYSKAIYLESTAITCNSILPYVLKQGSVLQGYNSQDGERDASSIVITY